MTKVLIVDDHPLYRAGIAGVLATSLPGGVILHASSAAEATRMLEAHPETDLVIVDLYLPGEDGLTALQAFGRQFPLVARVLISGQEEYSGLVAAAFQAGASGFISKSQPVDEVVLAVKTLLGGGIYQPQTLPASNISPSLQQPAAKSLLTLRQTEVLALLAQGASNKIIARQLNVAERTVKLHLSRLFEILGVDNRTQAVLAAQKMGLIST